MPISQDYLHHLAAEFPNKSDEELTAIGEARDYLADPMNDPYYRRLTEDFAELFNRLT